MERLMGDLLPPLWGWSSDTVSPPRWEVRVRGGFFPSPCFFFLIEV